MTIKLPWLRERLAAAFGCVVLSAAATGCSNPPVGQETEPSSSAGSPAPAPQGGSPLAGKSGGAGGSGTMTGTGQGTAGKAGSNGSPQAGRAAAAGGGGSAAPQAGTKAEAGSSAGGAGGSAAGSGGAGGPAAGSGGAAGEGEGSSDVKPPCLTKPSQLVVVGDSYLNWITHTFPDDFRSAFGAEYRMYAVGGSSMGSGGIAGFIPDQLKQAIADDGDIVASVMTGGGNDILIADTIMYPGSDTCKDRLDAPMDKVCQDVIANAMTVASELMDTAAAAGVRDVVYLFYPHIPGGGFGGMNPNAILDYSLPMARDLCTGAETRTEGKLHCHFVDLVPVFEGHPDWFADDGIHENSLGSAAMAQEVMKVLKDKCIAQSESSGCCEP
jgi:hypothetical protein